jgi:hypothetical protein
MSNAADEIMIGLVLAQIKAGANIVRIPQSLAVETTSEGRHDVRDLCEINEVTLELIDDE